MLRDSAHIQMFEAEWRNRKAKRQGKPEFVPAYTMEDALGVIRNFVGCPYETGIILGEGLRVKFIDAGHLLGSSSIEVNICCLLYTSSYFYEIKERLDASSEEKLHALVVWKTTNKGRDYLRKSYVKREVMFDNDVAELQYRTTESAEAALLGLEKQKYLSMAFEGLRPMLAI